jgi:hypothetical protein
MNGHEMRITGMSRSGNHAIIHWILSQAAGRTCFVNCAEPRCNPFTTARPTADGRAVVASYRPFCEASERRGAHSRKDLLVVSYEDCFLGPVASGEFERRHDEWVGKSLRRTDLIILRDPYNLFASRMRSGIGGVTQRAVLRIWKQHAREVLGIRRYLDSGRVAISYNRWVADRSYRRRLAAALGLAFTDAGRERVPATGNGSSFDGLSYDGRAQAMRTHERWRHFEHDRDFTALFDDEVHELSRRIFGTCEPEADVTCWRCKAYTAA